MSAWFLSGVRGASGCLAGALVGEILVGLLVPLGGPSLSAELGPEATRRLAGVNGKANDILIALFWDRQEPLELACIGPRQERVDREHPRSPSGGVWKGDEGGGGGSLTISWPQGTAREGTYQVVVAAPAQVGKGTVPFVCAIRSGNTVQEFSGLATPGETQTIGLFAFRRGGDAGRSSEALRGGLWNLLVAAGLCLALLAGGERRTAPVSVCLVAAAAAAGLGTGVGAQVLWELLGQGETARALGRGAAWVLLAAALGALTTRGGLADRGRGAALGAAGGVLGVLLAEVDGLFLEGPANRLLAAAGLGACVGMALGGAPARRVTTASPGGAPALSFRLGSGRVVPVVDGVSLRAADVPGCRPRLLRRTVARVVRKPDNPSVLGLQNLSRAEWAAALADGSTVRVDPGRSVLLVRGMRIHFGPAAVAEVC